MHKIISLVTYGKVKLKKSMHSLSVKPKLPTGKNYNDNLRNQQKNMK